MSTMPTGTSRLVRRLAAQLVDAGELTRPRWQRAFEQVPRELFVPHYATWETTDITRYRLVTSTDPAQRKEWLHTVYSDTTLITQIDGHPVEEHLTGNTGVGVWTSSATAPGLMARMLETLDVDDDHHVLELGTGTGYNAALLTRRLGDSHVTTIDVDPRLVASARERLAGLGYRPTVITGDARDGHEPGAPYDRIIATCSFFHVPPAWLTQTRPGGAILTDVSGWLGGAMLLAHVDQNGTAHGRFLPRWAGFMADRHRSPRAADITAQNTTDGYETGTTTLPPSLLRTDLAFAFVAQLHLGDARPYWATDDHGHPLAGLVTPDGSWAEIYAPDLHGNRTVEQGGPRRLWTEVETAHQWWRHQHHPDWSAFGITATSTQQHAWYLHPDGPRWRLPVA